MASRYGLLGLMVFLLVVILGFKNFEIWSYSGPRMSLKKDGKKSGGKPEAPPAFLPARERGSVGPYLAIAEKNIFSPDRKDFAAQVSGEAAPTGRPQVVLYGIVIADRFQTASVVSAGRPLLKGERELKTLKLGDEIGGYKLAKILPDRIMLEAAGDSFEVLLFDPKSAKRRTSVRTANPPPTISSGKPRTPSPAKPPSPVRSRTVSPRTTPTPVGPIPRRAIQVPSPQPKPPGAVPDPGIWRGRRP